MSESAPLLAAAKGRLRKVQTDDRSGRVAEVGADEVQRFEHRFLDAAIENWSQLLERPPPLTFPTAVVALQPEEARALWEACRRERRGEAPAVDRDPSLQQVSQRLQAAIDALLLLAQPQQQQPQQQQQQPQQQQQQQQQQRSFVFAKLSSRSAKDVARRSEKVRQRFCELLTSSASTADDNEKTAALLVASLEALKFRNAAEVLDTFVLSDRVAEDLQLAWERRAERFTLGIALRPWVDIDVSMEFRAFVFHHRMCALSQYNHAVCFPSLLPQKAAILATLQRFFEESVQPRLASFGDGSYVCDMAIDTAGHTWVIELNPYAESTDAALFSWREDGAGVLCGNKPFEFRMREQPIPNIRAVVEPSWRFFYDLKL